MKKSGGTPLPNGDTAAYKFTYKGAKWVVVYQRLDVPIGNHKWVVVVLRDGIPHEEGIIAPKQSLTRAKKLVATLK